MIDSDINLEPQILICVVRARSSSHDYLNRGLLLTTKLKKTSLQVVSFKASLRQFILIVSFHHSSLGLQHTLTRRTPLVRQALLTLKEYMNSPTVVCGFELLNRQICVVLYIIVSLFVHFCLDMVLSVLRFTSLVSSNFF